MTTSRLRSLVVRGLVLVCVKLVVIGALAQTAPPPVAGQSSPGMATQTKAAEAENAGERERRQREKAAKWVQDLHRPLVKVVLATSRPEVTRDHAWGLTADIQNVGQVPIVLRADEILLVMQPEVRSDTGEGLPSFLAGSEGGTEEEDETVIDRANGTEGKRGSVTLQAGDHALFFWNAQKGEQDEKGQIARRARIAGKTGALPPGEPKESWLAHLEDTMNFLPGPYTFNVVGRVHLADEPKVSVAESSPHLPGSGSPRRRRAHAIAFASGTVPEEAYRTFSESITVKLGIGQMGLWLCAGLGAVLAYAMVALRDHGDVDRVQQASTRAERGRAMGRLALNAASAFLLGAVMSVVANRLSDTQFPVKVAVNDVWGAMTVGFVFFFIGGKFIDKLKGLVAESSPTKSVVRERPGLQDVVPAHGM